MGKNMISVIIPVYNTQKELYRCLKSIQKQAYGNLEIICIDDGSTDGSELIVDEFVKDDSRFIGIHQKNAGESNARNTGLKRATGEYIAFCDCDDWIDFDMYKIMMETMKQYDVDMVATSWYKESQKDGNYQCTEIVNELPVKKGTIGNKQLLRYIYERDSYRGFAYMWNKLYKREIVSDESGDMLLFDESLKLGGDVVYLAEAALKAKKAIYIDKAFYHYNQRMSSGCHTNDVKRLRDWVKAYEIIIQKFTKENVDQDIINYVKRFLVYHCSNAAQLSYEQEKVEDLNLFQQFMRQYGKEYLELNVNYPERIERYYNILNYKI